MYRIYGIEASGETEPYVAWENGLHPEDKDRSVRELDSAIQGKKEFNTTFRVISPSSEIRYVRAIAKVIRDDSGSAVSMIGVNWDVTDQKFLEFKLQEEKEKAEAANYSKSMFLANMSHEIRTPMNGILGMTNIILDNVTDNEMKKQLEIISSSADALLSIINNILDISKLDSGKFEVEVLNFNLHKLLKDIYKLFNFSAEEKGLSLILDIPKDIPEWVIADEIKIRQVITNLVGNAIKFTPTGSITISLQLISKKENQNIISFSIVDTGVGIEKSKLEDVFDIFTQADLTTRRNFGGTGLGLSISQKLTHLMGSKITLDSEVGKGSCFKFDILMLTGTEEDSNSVNESFDITPKFKDLYPLNILLVDDTKFNLVVAKSTLNKFGYMSLDMAHNGKEALDKVNENYYDLILLDCHMPVMDGFEFTKIFKDQFPNIKTKIVALTASAMEQDRKKCIEVGMDYFLSKPIDVKEVGKVLIKTFEEK
jgi:signal transduction histidine kinase